MPLELDLHRDRHAPARRPLLHAGRAAAGRRAVPARQLHELLHRPGAHGAAAAGRDGLRMPRLQPARPRHDRDDEQPRRHRRRVPDDARGDRRQSPCRTVARGARLRAPRSSSATRTAACSPCSMSRTIPTRPRWCCSRPTSAARRSSRSPARPACSARDRIDEIEATARRMVAEGRGKELIAAARMVLGHHGGDLARLHQHVARRAGARAARHMPGALYPRRQGARPHLSGGGIRRPRRWAMRGPHRGKLRPLLWRAGRRA